MVSAHCQSPAIPSPGAPPSLRFLFYRPPSPFHLSYFFPPSPPLLLLSFSLLLSLLHPLGPVSICFSPFKGRT
ncbi:uncharacterized protein BO97DRAFT_263972 [Aspergillus homomorphus CBS 101889]|uniref:Uncharacterized protein n=1 Tax=Aspergillus homomorphus (strain CBS 101889) TaxID=1450537 RepID=A0A395HLY0_ASPHC|nr:hypothetical protein BO97DRAFT_263972 [Aspergillus homomorphus CBS 101889]RAL07274.1 hypothetical protein BO97DRAFT_263972 [Aspergillus homomorphus CBS 101889]